MGMGLFSAPCTIPETVIVSARFSIAQRNVMRLLIPTLILMMVAAATATAQPDDCKDCIIWQTDRPLTWDDFKAKPQASSPNKAMTDSGMSIAFSCKDNVADITLMCYFRPSKSWTKTRESDRLLAHEQLHFDITELFTRKLRKKLSEMDADCEKMHRAIGKIYDSNYNELLRYQQQYDRETQHSIKEEEQLRWEKKVKEELKALSDYSS
jgi:hypothetical protein